MSCNILVSGADGQLGKSLQEISEEYPDFSFDFMNRKSLDIGDPDSIENIFKTNYNYFINTAAYTAVDKAESEPELCYKINSQALQDIAKYCPPSCKIIHISSDYVYHHNPGRALLESDITDPKSVYAKSKLQGESYLLKERPNSIVIRSSWIFSNYGQNFVKTILRLSDQREKLSIVSDQSGSPSYAFDLAKAILDIISYLENNISSNLKLGGIYNYSNEGLTNWADFADQICKLSKRSCSIDKITTEEYPTPASRPLWSYMSSEKIIESFDLVIPSWKESLKDCLSKLGVHK